MKRHKHSLSHYNLLTGNMGMLLPLTWYEAIPGDTFQQRTSALIRVSPLLRPLMHPVKVRIHSFFVPNRLLWERSGGSNNGWEDFITGGPDGTSTPTHPYIDLASLNEGTLLEYLGLPADTYGGTIRVNALPLRAYKLIYNEFYRDQDIITEETIDKTSGADTTTDTSVNYASWEKDYFTTCRPWEQKGSTVTIPLGDTAPVESSGDGVPRFDGATAGTNAALNVFGGGSGQDAGWGAALTGNAQWNDPKLQTDLSSATGIDINDLRLALSLQRFQEARAKHGSRYVEYLAYLGVKSSDARLQNPEYLGGARQTIQFTEVLSTDGSNTGDMKGHGIGVVRTPRFRRFFNEHGIVMTVMSVIPKSIYASGIHRKFLRTTKEDYFQKELQFIGEQAVTNKEVYAADSAPDTVFGYQSRYDEYRSHPSTVASEFNSTQNDWHMARILGSDPALNSTFLNCTPTTRIYAATAADQIYIMSNHSIQARRLLASRAKNKTF